MVEERRRAGRRLAKSRHTFGSQLQAAHARGVNMRPQGPYTPAPMTIRRKRVTVWVWECRCERCGHAWTSSSKSPPVTCANAGCKARNWQRAARPYRRRKA
jgi:hypothetical protein